MERKGTASADVRFLFDGRDIRARPGVSLAAALVAAGELELRETKTGARRGMFCGMGVCQECLVNVDGRSGVRACMTPVEAGVRVVRERAVASLGSHAEAGAESGAPLATVTPEVLVIGAGPAGLLAASIAAESGAEVTVLDERSAGGGQYYKQPSSAAVVPESLAQDRQFSDGRRLIDRALRAGAELVTGAEVWGAFAPNELAVFDGVASRVYRPKKTIVATGAHERGLPVPGWTLPGVMTTGAAQTLLRSYGTLPGRRILVAGNGPFNLQVALELGRVGADIVAVLELAALSPGARLLHGARLGLSVPSLTLAGIRYVSGLRKLGVPLLWQQGLASIEKTDAGLIARVGRAREGGIDAVDAYEADIVCMGYGFQPSNEILRCLGCRHRYDADRGHLVTERDRYGETSVPGVYAIGDCSGFSGAAAALQDGVIAAIGVVEALARPVSARHRREYRSALRRLRRHRRFQSALWRLFQAPRFYTELASPETVLCRCENVSLADVEEAIAVHGRTLGAIKRRTRLGMGPCQGRYCAPVVLHMLAKDHGQMIDEYSFFAPRSPLKPIRIRDMLATADR